MEQHNNPSDLEDQGTDPVLSYFNRDNLASDVWKGKYKATGEIIPDDMHRRMAKDFARIELNYENNDFLIINDKNFPLNGISEYGKNRKPLNEKSIYNLFKDFKYIIPQGSGMSGIGIWNKFVSLSNCFFVGQPHDSYGGIMQKDQELVQLMKRRGGVGIDISTLRPSDTAVSNSAGTSTGAISFMERFSNSTREVGQNNRRGALMITIDVNHPDVEQFATIKSDKTKVTGANISIKLNKEFMEAVENDEDYLLRWPCNFIFEQEYPSTFEYDKLTEVKHPNNVVTYVKRIKAKDLWNTITQQARDNAEPGLLFWDKTETYGPDAVYDQYRPLGTNPCFVYDTPILTAEGYYKIGELEGQDTDFINKDGEIVPGTVFKTGARTTYILKLSNGEIIETTPEHRFMLANGSEEEAQNIVEKGDRLMPFFNINSSINEFVKYGFIQGDGQTGRLRSKEHLGLEINVGKDDGDIAELFNVGIGKNYIGGYNETLKELGFSMNSLPDRTLPTTFNNWSSENKLMFLKGLWSANGCIIGKYRISFKSTCKKLIEELQEVLLSFGIDSYYTTNKPKKVKFSNGTYLCKESYDLNIGRYDSVLEFANKIGFVHKYKQESLRNLILEKAPKVISKKQGTTQFVYDFTLYDNTHWGVVQGVIVHNCGEITLQPYDSCRLMVINLFSFVKNPFTIDSYIDYELLYQVSYEQQRLMDDFVDLEIEAVDKIINKIENDEGPEEIKAIELNLWKKIKETGLAGRRTGSGITALGDMLAALGIKYDSKEGLEIADKVMRTKMKAELDCTIDLAILRGSFKGWENTKEFNTSGTEFLGKGKNDFYQMLINEFPYQVERMLTYGRRNVSWSTIAPTGSVSILTQTTSGLEPLFMPFYIRSKKITDKDSDVKVAYIDESGDKWQEYAVLHPKFKDWYKQYVKVRREDFTEEGFDNTVLEYLNKDRLQKLFEKSPWYGSTANDIDWKNRVEMQSILQKYTTHSISSTLNLPKDTPVETVRDIYFEAWKKGLKGVTIYREGSRDGVLNAEGKKNKTSFEQHDAPKRPKTLPCQIHKTVVKGTEYLVVVGLFEGKPYEVFAQENKWNIKGNHLEGEAVKVKSGVYNIVIIDPMLYSTSTLLLENFTSDMEPVQEDITRGYSYGLRHGGNVEYAVEQLGKSKSSLVDFSKAIARVLSRYVPEKSTGDCPECKTGTLIMQEGCTKCNSCQYSKC